MKRNYVLLALICMSGALSLTPPAVSTAVAATEVIASRTAEAGGVKIHYLTAGQGPPLFLVHGYAETSRMWRPVIPVLAKRFTVIAPDLPGIGDSSIPATGLDMKNAAL